MPLTQDAKSDHLDLLLLVEVNTRSGGNCWLARPHDGILAGHATVERALQLGAQSELLQVDALLLGQVHALLCQSLVLHAVESISNVGDLSNGAVSGAEGGRNRVGHGGRHGEADGGAVLGLGRSGHCQFGSKSSVWIM